MHGGGRRTRLSCITGGRQLIAKPLGSGGRGLGGRSIPVVRSNGGRKRASRIVAALLVALALGVAATGLRLRNVAIHTEGLTTTALTYAEKADNAAQNADHSSVEQLRSLTVAHGKTIRDLVSYIELLDGGIRKAANLLVYLSVVIAAVAFWAYRQQSRLNRRDESAA